ncbi:MAG TPA: hypothetical protein VF634_02040, partial [Pyrinomonadaceae bacterium]
MKIYRLLGILILLIICATGGFAYWFHRELNKPVAHSHATQYIEIPRGSTPDETITRLESFGVIGRSWPLRLY